MKKFKRLIACALAVLLMITSIPAASITAIATEVNDLVSTINTETEEQTGETEQTKTYSVSTNSSIVLPTNTQLTRAEWIHNLVVVFEMTVESDALPDNYFSDLTESHKYYEDIILAVEFGVVNIEAGSELKPDDAATREFAVSTLNFCLGYQLGEETSYTFTDADICVDPVSAQIAIDRGWVELIDGAFSPETYITTAEAEIMLNDAGSVLQGQIIDENYESNYTFATDIIVIPEGTDVLEGEDGKIYITDCPESVLVDDKIAVYFNGIPSFYKVINVSFSDNVTVLEVETLEADDALLDVDAQGVISADSMEVIAADGVDVTVEDDSAISGFAVKKVRNITSELPISFGGITGKVSVKIKDPYIDYYVDSGRVYVALCGETEVKYSISASLAQAAGLSKGFSLFTVNIMGIGSFDITINVDFSGSASGTVKGWLVAGVECEKGGSIRAVKSFTQKEYYTSVEAETYVSLKASLGVTKMPVISAYVYAEVGVKANFSKKTYSDEQSPTTCTHFAAYLFARYGASASAKFGIWKTSESLTYTIFDESNSPVRIVNHYEDGQLVAKCTRGTSYANFFTKSSSRWSGCGWISANGAYALNADGTYFPLYKYTLDENNQATITKYNGYSWSVYIPKEIDGYTVVAIGTYAFRNSTVRHVVIPDTVTTIGSEAFDSCYYLSSVTIPESVTVINGSAFEYCSSLSSITLPSSLQTLGYGAFRECSSLTSVKIPDSITSISDRVFYNCYNLRSVTLPKEVTYLGALAFANTAIDSIYIPKTLDSCNTADASYQFNGTNYSMPGGPFFGCENLNNVTFEQGTEQVASSLFSGCVGLNNISLPNTITTIEYGAFRSCVRLSSVDLNEFVTVINNNAFRYCVSLAQVKIPDSVTSIGDCVFDHCSSLKEVTLSKGLLSMGYGAFSDTAIEKIEIPKSLDYCGAEFGLYGNGYNYDLDGTNYMIGWGPFYHCENLKTVTFESGITTIPSYVFTGCTGFDTITIPDTVTVIEGSAFRDCLNLKTLTIGNSVTSIGNFSFSQCVQLPKVVIPNSVNTIGEQAFDECFALKDVTLSKGLTYLSSGAFSRTAIESIEIPKSLDSCGSDFSLYGNGYNYELDGTNYMIGWGPFYCCENLKTVTFEEGTTQIASYLFNGCTGLEEITIPDTITVVETRAFRDCLRLKKVNIGSSVNTLKDGAFRQCVSLTDINIPETVATIEEYAFYKCHALEKVEIPNASATLGDYVFYECTSLKDVSLPTNLTTIREGLFRDCIALEMIELPENITSLGSYAFNGCIALKEMVLPEKVKTIGTYAFQNCKALEKVSIPQSTKTINNYAFMGCESLKDVSIADYSIKAINHSVFKDCPAIQKITLPKGLESIGAQSFVNDTGLVEVTIPESVTTIDVTAFSYPDKTTIYGKTGSYAETFATNNGFAFVDSYVAAEGISLLDGVEYIVLDRGDTYRAIFEFFPENATDVITLTANNTNVTIDGHDIYARYVGDTVITATATSGVTYEFTIHIRNASSISVVTQPTKVSYIMGEELDLTGMVVQVNYNDSSVREITDYVVSGFDSSVEGDCVVTVKWTSVYGSTYSTTFTVNIVDPRPKLTGIYIDTMPTKREYERKESLDLTGLVVIATYTDDSEIAITDYTVSGYNALKNGMQTITVTYNGFTTTFTVAVGQKLVIMGDLSGDEVITQEDIDLISSYDAGLVELTTEQLSAGDLNGDGVVDAGDAIIVSMYCAGLITTL